MTGKKLEINGVIDFIYHSYCDVGNAAHQLTGLTVDRKNWEGFSEIDIKVGRKEMVIVRPNGESFNWQGEGDIKSGSKVKLTLEIVK